MLYKLNNHSILELEETLKILPNEKTTTQNDKVTLPNVRGNDRARIRLFKTPNLAFQKLPVQIASKISGILVFHVMADCVASSFCLFYFIRQLILI